MAEQEENDSGVSGQQTPKAHDSFAPEKPWPVCPRCFQPCNPLDNYCLNCDSNEAMNPLATYMPLESIRFIAGMYGKMFNAVFFQKHTSLIRRFVYLIILVQAVPIILVVALPLSLTERIKNPELRKAAMIVVVLLLLLMVWLALWPYSTDYRGFERNY